MHCRPLSLDPTEVIGGKAANLARVQALGCSVPETVVVARSALSQTLGAANLLPRLEAYLHSFESASSTALTATYGTLCEALLEVGLPDEVLREVVATAASVLAKSTCGLAVRSSAIYEDSATASFAGVFESELGIRDPGVRTEPIGPPYTQPYACPPTERYTGQWFMHAPQRMQRSM